jgi:citrate lyase subunit beta/citryl-CoA lyase
VQKFVDRASRSEADAIQLDLEDGVAPPDKADARRGIAVAARRIAASGIDVIVRINRPLALAVRDIEASVGPDVMALSLPKVESADHVRLLSEVVGEAELRAGMNPGGTRFILGIESPSAWFQMQAIAAADTRNVAMLLGTEDFATAVGMAVSAENFAGPKQMMVLAATAAGIAPLGIVGSFANFRDTDNFRAMVLKSRQLGFRGSSCIHPDQIPILNAGFSPPEEEVENARKIVEKFSAAQKGAVGLDGNMIDLPVLERARALLYEHQRIMERATRVGN